MADFKPFSSLVHERYTQLALSGELFTTLSGDELWAVYLAAFPEGSNPIFRERTEHDCSCCRNFIKNLGGLVSLDANGFISTVWDTAVSLGGLYAVVADDMRDAVLGAAITGLFRTKERSYGAEVTYEHAVGKAPLTWNHFHGRVADRHFSQTPDGDRGNYATSVAVFKRGLEEIKAEALDTVVGLIEAKALYRGEEHLAAITQFRTAQELYAKQDSEQTRAIVLWVNGRLPVARFRNTVIGTLLVDLSEGVELEVAVKAFEKKVAPENYQRTTALVTPGMIKQAMATIEELGIEQSLERRLAVIGDVSVNDVLWVDNKVRSAMKGGTLGLLESLVSAAAPASSSAERDISVEDFMAQVVPTAASMDIFLAGSLQNNLMTLTAPVHEGAEQLFKWDNGFGWSYNGNITDSIKDKVKRAGGNTGAALRVSLAWFNGDDLDIHCQDPKGNHISFSNKMNVLDVDMNAGCARNSKDPVENLSWTRPADGAYAITVHNYSKRSNDNPGFVIEVENAGKVSQYTLSRAVRSNEQVMVGHLIVEGGVIVEARINGELKGGGISQDAWSLKTEQFAKVSTLMLSPNHWGDSQVGNKHWFFVLEGCKVDTPVRGIYNEFLKSELLGHRKVFELLGDKTKCPVTDQQLSGLGFSSTRGDTVKVRVASDKSTLIYNVKF